jgi:hypothetical protein
MYECFVSANTRTTSLLMRLEDCPPAHSLHMHACILPHALHNASEGEEKGEERNADHVGVRECAYCL